MIYASNALERTAIYFIRYLHNALPAKDLNLLSCSAGRRILTSVYLNVATVGVAGLSGWFGWQNNYNKLHS